MMSVLARYVIRAVLGHTLLVMLVLLALSGLYLFITQQDDIGVGTYTLDDAFLFVGLSLPQYAFDMLPIAALIGALLALGNLARSMELIVVRAAGVSTCAHRAVGRRRGRDPDAAAPAVLGEFVAPQMEHYARQMKTFEKFRDYSMAGNRSAWAKDGDTIISVRPAVGRQQLRRRLRLQLRRAAAPAQRRAARAMRSIDANNRWRLEDYREIAHRGRPRRAAPAARRRELQTACRAEFLGLAVLDPDRCPGAACCSYVRHLKANGLDARAYETAFWARIARTVAVAIIVVLAVPFAFGPMRSTGTGARTVVGIMIGVVFFLLARMLESGGAVFDLPPVVVAWTPTVAAGADHTIAVARVR